MRIAIHGTAHPTATISADIRQLAWYAGGVTAGFLTPFVFSSTLDLHHDLYYAIYFGVVGLFLAAYVHATELDVVALFTRHWRWSLALGVVAAGVVALAVLSREDSTARPEGAYFLFTVGWRGLLYGIVDALLLSAFPVAVAYALAGGRPGIAGKAMFAGLALVLVMVITAAYHLGYEQFRDDGVGGPETGNTIISIPAIATANPLGAVVAHATMHITADIHAYETDVYLPPETSADE